MQRTRPRPRGFEEPACVSFALVLHTVLQRLKARDTLEQGIKGFSQGAVAPRRSCSSDVPAPGDDPPAGETGLLIWLSGRANRGALPGWMMSVKG